jgi:hypothetical protein
MRVYLVSKMFSDFVDLLQPVENVYWWHQMRGRYFGECGEPLVIVTTLRKSRCVRCSNDRKLLLVSHYFVDLVESCMSVVFCYDKIRFCMDWMYEASSRLVCAMVDFWVWLILNFSESGASLIVCRMLFYLSCCSLVTSSYLLLRDNNTSLWWHPSLWHNFCYNF